MARPPLPLEDRRPVHGRHGPYARMESPAREYVKGHLTVFRVAFCCACLAQYKLGPRRPAKKTAWPVTTTRKARSAKSTPMVRQATERPPDGRARKSPHRSRDGRRSSTP